MKTISAELLTYRIGRDGALRRPRRVRRRHPAVDTPGSAGFIQVGGSSLGEPHLTGPPFHQTLMRLPCLTCTVAFLFICSGAPDAAAASPVRAISSAGDPLIWISISNRWGATPLAQLRTLADGDEPSAQYFLGWRFEFGIGLPNDKTEASKWYRVSAEHGFAPAQFLLGARAERQPELQGQTIVGNFQVASEWYEKAAQQGYVPAMVSLGDLYYYGKLERDHNAAAKWFRLAAEKGNQQAVLRLGELYLYNRGDLLQNHAESAKWFRLAAENGNAEAQYQLALLFLSGQGIPHEPAQARQWLEKAAAQGYPKAIVKLSTLPGSTISGLSQLGRPELESLALGGGGPALLALAVDYEEGRGGERNYYRAAGLYWQILTLNAILDKEVATNIVEAAHRLVGLYADQKVEPVSTVPGLVTAASGLAGDYNFIAPKSPVELAQRLQNSQTAIARPEDQLRVGEMFYVGKIVPEDRQQAVDWFVKAAKAGNPDSINRIGELWATGVDGVPDSKEAARWYRRAATKGSVAAQLNIGRAYEKGDGVDKDLVQAWVWLQTAAEHGAKLALTELDFVQSQLTPEQLRSARNSTATH